MNRGWEIRYFGIGWYSSELEQLRGDIGGRAVIEKHPDQCLHVEIGEEELKRYRPQDGFM